MKRLIVLVILLFVAQLSYGADYLDDIDDMTVMVYQNLGLKSSTTAKIDDTTIQKYIKSAVSVLSARGVREWRDTVITVQYQSDYTLDSQLVQVMGVHWHHMDSTKGLLNISTNQLDTLLGIGKTLRTKKGFLTRPSFYHWVNGRITLFPTPYKADDTMIIDGIAKVDDIDTSTTFPSEILVTYRPMIAAYATALTAASLNNFEKAQWWYRVFKDEATLLGVTVSTGMKPE